jgi:S-adenosylmethionine:tRNA ribosyltransferase-isomerase
MRIEELDYELPAELIAQAPVEPRDASRLLVYGRSSGTLEDHRFADLPSLLAPGDLLVRNDTKVIPARTHFRRASGGRLEVLFLEAMAGAAPRPESEVWEVLLRGRPRVGEVLTFAAADTGTQRDSAGATDDWRLRVEQRLGEGRWLVRSLSDRPVRALLEDDGETPLPPYIKTRLDQRERYQTVYARVPGSAAAPTAGLHFTGELDERLAARGITVEELTLHVGLGTFQPVTTETVEAHRLHSEPYSVDRRAWARIARARSAGRRVIAVGTTMTRLLETLARDPRCAPGAGHMGPRREGAGSASGTRGRVIEGRTSLFITPGFEFKVVGGLLTNFHLPRTSLLALVMAFCGVELTRVLYRHAIERRYRFYSFGDAMLAL